MIVLARVSVLKRHLGFVGAEDGHNNRFLLESRIACRCQYLVRSFFLASMAESNDNMCPFGPSPLLKKVCAMLQQTNTIYQLPCDCLKRDVSQMASPICSNFLQMLLFQLSRLVALCWMVAVG